MAKKKVRPPDPCEICPVYKLLLGLMSQKGPPDILHHLIEARKEVLLAIRSMIDAAIEKTEKREKKAQKIKVE